MYHLKLCKGLSYSNGKVTATKRNPCVFVDDKATADAAVASGYFKLVGETPSFPPIGKTLGHLDQEQLESMTIPDLKKLAGEVVRTSRASRTRGPSSRLLLPLRSAPRPLMRRRWPPCLTTS